MLLQSVHTQALIVNGTFVLCGSSPEEMAQRSGGNIKSGGADTIHQFTRLPCNTYSREEKRYRTYDGTCNARDDLGAAFSPVKRIMEPFYQGENSGPRELSKSGGKLPNARSVSRAVHFAKETRTDNTLLLMQVGQFLDHDLDLVPVATERDNTIDCCNVSPEQRFHDCMPIEIDAGDPNFKTCMQMVRSEAITLPNGTVPNPRTHFNAITAWIDASSIYVKAPFSLQDLFGVSRHNLENYRNIIRGLTSRTNNAETFDTHMASSLTEKLFSNNPERKPGFDLATLNIQRGRDHGLPAFNDLREHYQLKRFENWEEFGEAGQALSQLYESPDDVDLFTGGTSESPVEGGIVGEVFANIIAEQFSDLKRGDRYYFETDDTFYGFTDRELRSVRRFGLSKILCENANLMWIQSNPFKHWDFSSNPFYLCMALPDVDIWYWTRYIM